MNLQQPRVRPFRFRLLPVAVLAALPMGTPLAADTVNGFEFSGNVTLATDYVFRGISQTAEEPAVQGGLDVVHESGAYLGAWGSNVNFEDGDEASLELDFYGGLAGSGAGFAWDVGVVYYAYPGAEASLDYDFWEGYVVLGRDFGAAEASVGAYVSPEFFGDTGDAQYYTADVSFGLPADVALGLHAGYQRIDEADNYTDWSVGISKTFAGTDIALTYTDTDIDDSAYADDRVVLSASRSF